MLKTVEYMNIDIDEDYAFVDVRSNGEYEEFTIPGALNIPIFDNEERKIIGTIYKNESIDKAKKVGIQFVSAKLLELYEKFSELKSSHKEVIIFCERGGMRSSSLWSLFNSIGLRTIKLEGGYKGYRAAINENLPKVVEDVTFIMLHGHTGTGKTELLKKLEQNGLDVLDLEGYANHRGSLLGDVGLPGKVSQKKFDALVFEKLRRRKSNYVLIEAESGRIGNILIPQFMHNRMKQGIHLLVEGSLEARAKRIVDEYIVNENSKQEILDALEKLGRYLGASKTEHIAKLVQAEDYMEATRELMVLHYDPLYGKGQQRYEFSLTVNSDDMDAATERIEEFVNHILEQSKEV
ncbi:MAG: tRNA 2-selenouridine synthase [Clostridia bacterium]|nr:tRNA 2-selenouridine synthase [Clostridia bacterium]